MDTTPAMQTLQPKASNMKRKRIGYLKDGGKYRNPYNVTMISSASGKHHCTFDEGNTG